MRYARILHEGRARFGIIEDDRCARLLTAAPWEGGTPLAEVVDLTPAARLVPVCPSKIVCVGKNYAAHARELGGDVPSTPLLFLKAPTTLLAPGEAIQLPRESQRVDHEGELALVIGKTLRRVSVAEAGDGIFGLTVANDVTARDLQRADVQFTRAKSFDTFCPVGPHVVRGIDPGALAIEVRVNGATRQSGSTADMVFSAAALVSFISSVMTLLPGDLVLTGTPEGVGPLSAGDTVTVSIEDLGTLENPVVAEP
jgi:2-keto-4-pentenoate hydratase/2-oxohepta-3-ene-1,7-dioic acid hydratase in catechol pathway